MAASELIEEEEVRIPVETNVTSSNSPTQIHPQRVANGNPTRHAATPPPLPDDHDGRGGLCSLMLIESLNNKLKRRCDYEKICGEAEPADSLPSEWWKTGVAFLYAFFNLIFTTVVITVVHERVPDKSVSPPLPDKFFDYVDRVPWAFTITETNGLILVGLWLVQWLLLKHKAIVGRRCFFLIGTLYMYRCLTMYITTLPAPGKHMVCAPKLYNDSMGKIWRILRLISGGGLSLTGSHLMCGDYLYSGHTVMLTLSYLFIQEYSPRWMWWYRWACWVLSASGVVCILVGHEHYSIDVVIAYYITTRTFWWYHTMANNHVSPISHSRTIGSERDRGFKAGPLGQSGTVGSKRDRWVRAGPLGQSGTVGLKRDRWVRAGPSG
ncbi:phosphatidylcholine:ceramide cholinephosphotransferase 2-like isoform X1 [Poeciliopsis prolifica]|nr:phosphatidylcholine:ceramide cholinephosphotransferase 2-like isoform X1 [Poeciliopsis prolifica]XP_054912232.1 phosphatidylcholine:ceramide cholinephosphotransferase 2-like isoform X1 [Poeciliopsis prolifica]